MMETPNQELLPSRDMLQLLAIDDEEERNSLIETIKAESEHQESRLAKSRIAKQFFKLQKQELTLFQHQERFGFNRQSEKTQLLEHIAKQKERILKMPYAESFKEYLTVPLALLIHLNTGELIKVGQVYKGERYNKPMNYTVKEIDCQNFKVKLTYDYYGTEYEDEMTLRKISQMNLTES